MSDQNKPGANHVPDGSEPENPSGYQPPVQPPVPGQSVPLPAQQSSAANQPPMPMAPQGYTQQIPQPSPAPYGAQVDAHGYPVGQSQQPPYGQPQAQSYGQPYPGPQGQSYSQPQGQPYGHPYQPPQQPYPPYDPYAQQPPKRKIWPWVLVGCLLLGMLGIGGCVGCVALTSYISDAGSSSYNRYYDGYEYGYDYGDDYDFDFDYEFDADDYSHLYTYSYTDIMAEKYLYDNVIENGAASGGIYEVGAGKDLPAGRYFLEGDPTMEGRYLVYEPSDSATSESGADPSYEVTESVVYFGNYRVDLEAGDIVLFEPSGDHTMMPETSAAFEPVSPYKGGLYRVGTDIPAGSYKVTYDGPAAMNASMEAAAYIMKDLDWDSDSITDTYYVVQGSSHTIELTEGQWVEAYAVTITPTSTTV